MSTSDGRYYVYAYLDVRKPGEYIYQVADKTVKFDYEPFYIGKGRFNRIYCFSNHNKHCRRKLNKILPLVKSKDEILWKQGCVSEKRALFWERKLILAIGTIRLHKSILTNIAVGFSTPRTEFSKAIFYKDGKKIVTYNVRDFACENKLNYGSLIRVVNGSQKEYNGYTLKNVDAKELRRNIEIQRKEKQRLRRLKTRIYYDINNKKIVINDMQKFKIDNNITSMKDNGYTKIKKVYYTFYDIKNVKHTFLNLAEFCRNNKLSLSFMSNVNTGKITMYRGWSLKPIKDKTVHGRCIYNVTNILTGKTIKTKNLKRFTLNNNLVIQCVFRSMQLDKPYKNFKFEKAA